MVDNDTSFLEEEHAVSNYAELVNAGVKKLAQLKLTMDEAEAAYNKAKNEYNIYRSTDLPQTLRNAGITSCVLDSGLTLSIKQEVTCSPNKNAADKAALVSWLDTHEGGHLVKKTYLIGEQDVEKVKAMGINCMEETSVNTNSLKSWLKSQLGMDGISPAVIETTDIPDYVHFYAIEVAVLK